VAKPARRALIRWFISFADFLAESQNLVEFRIVLDVPETASIELSERDIAFEFGKLPFHLFQSLFNGS
jgi:hypothetical protein